MRWKRSVIAAILPQAAAKQREMHRLVRAYAHPVIREFGPELRPEPAHKIEGQVDGDELDVRQSVQHGNAPTLRSAFPPLRHVRWTQQFRLIGPERTSTRR